MMQQAHSEFLGAKLAPIWQANVQQAVYMQLLDAMSFVGKLVCLPEEALSEGAQVAVLAALGDGAVALADPQSMLDKGCWSLLQMQSAPCEQAQFVVLNGEKYHDCAYAKGSLASPELGATLVLSVDALADKATHNALAISVSGPGVNGDRTFWVQGLNTQWLALHQSHKAHFPMGVDVLLVSNHQLVALPRTAKIIWQTEA